VPPATPAPAPASAEASGTRKTVAVLIDHIDHLSTGYEYHLRGAFAAACAKHDLNLMILVGRGIDHPDPTSGAHNIVYQLVHPDCVDGIVLVTAGLGAFCGEEGIARVCERYRPLPVCSLGVAVPGVPSIISDHPRGMQAILEHVICNHGCRRVAFLGGPAGNPEAEVRLQVYRRMLEQHNLPFEPRLVGSGDFSVIDGRAVTDALLRRGARFDALVAANDGMALGAIEALAARGIRVPRDVCVTGFDDLDLARFSSPPLTTIRQPLERMATLAIAALVAQIAGQPVQDSTLLPVELVTRKSCGCGFRSESSPPRQLPDSEPHEFVRQHADRLGQRLAVLLRVPGARSTEDARYLVRALRAELEGHQDAFIVALEDLLEQYGEHNELYEELQAVVTRLRAEVGAAQGAALEGLWHSARCTIASANTRVQAQQRLHIDATYLSLMRCGERFSTALDLDSLRQALAEELPRLGIDEALFCLFADQPKSQARPFFWMRDGRACEPPFAVLPTTQVLAASAYCRDRRHTAFVLPLTFEGEPLGVVVFELGTGISVYEMLREQISVAVKNVAFREEIVRKTALHERSVQERAAANERMTSLSALAGGVAHDLNSTMAPLIVLPDVVLASLKRVGPGALSDTQAVRGHIETIKAAAVKATETIRDLMTLGRQGNVEKQRVDLNRVVSNSLIGEPQLVTEGASRKAELALELYPEPLFVQASQHHLERAVANLVRNAVEATDDDGKIRVSVSHEWLHEPFCGYESVPPGRYAVITVADTGAGIPAEHLGRVFEPFFSKKQLGNRSGSGLGLSIVHTVVKEHDGYVNVASSAGNGTTFTLYLPLATESQR
jgi:DNA-binding LacI/PurR family transcriptional regulator/signal transduction histidine kinase